MDDLRKTRTSRHLPIAEHVAGEAEATVVDKFETRKVLLTADTARLQTKNGQLMLMVAANLISRFARCVDIALPSGNEDLVAQLRQLLLAIDSTLSTHTVTPKDVGGYAVVLSVGQCHHLAPNVVEIDANGWIAFVSNGSHGPIAREAQDQNPFGALVAAALGGSEVFKHLVNLRSDRGSFLTHTSFSALDFSVGKVHTDVPLAPCPAAPPTLLAGVGAVGNAFLFAIAQLPEISGDLAAIDNQTLDDPSNLNRYLLARESDFAPGMELPKVYLASRLFKGTRLSVYPAQADVRDIPAALSRRDFPRPEVIISALDENPPRHEIQDFWPDMLIEGATDSTLAQISRHEYRRGLACLKCIHPAASPTAVPYDEHIHSISGLPIEWIRQGTADPDLPLVDKDLQNAPSDTRLRLAGLVGKPACSVLAEIERLSSLKPADLPVSPTVSFVSAMAGFLAAAEYAKYVTGIASPLETFFQVDLMFPLSNAFMQTVQKVSNCYCVERKGVIEEYRRRSGCPF